MSDRLTVEQLRSAPIGVHISRRARRGEYDPEQVIGTPQECVDAGSLDQRVLAYPIPGEITTAEAAALLGVSCQRIRTLIRSGQIVGARRIDAPRGAQWVIPTGPDGMPTINDWRKGQPGPRKGERR